MMHINMDGVGKLVVRSSYVARIAVIVWTTSTHRDVASDKISFPLPIKSIEGILLMS